VAAWVDAQALKAATRGFGKPTRVAKFSFLFQRLADSLCAFEPIIVEGQQDSASPLPSPVVALVPGKGGPSSFPTAHPGRLPKALQNHLLDSVVGCLTNARWCQEESYRFVSDILLYCFGADVSAASLGKQWRRRHPAKAHP
jgi:hypothetical protein